MPVVFDQVIGEVVPPTPSSPEIKSEPPPIGVSDRSVQTTLRHLAKRCDRLKAD